MYGKGLEKMRMGIQLQLVSENTFIISHKARFESVGRLLSNSQRQIFSINIWFYILIQKVLSVQFSVYGLSRQNN